MNRLLSKCPVCSGELSVTRLYCPQCDTVIEGQFSARHDPLGSLTPEQMQFVLAFIRCEGRFNRLEDEFKLSYPTLRNRFNEILRVLGFEPAREEASPRVTPDERRRILDDLENGAISVEEAHNLLKREPAKN